MIAVASSRSVVGGGALLLAGCDKLAGTSWFSGLLAKAGPFTEAAQTAITPTNALAREFTEADIAPHFRANGSIDPQDDDYLDHVDNNFADWKLEIRGLVERPYSLSLAELRALPSRTQITRHDCVEGWSAIGKWKGVPLRAMLERAGVGSRRRATSCSGCMDTLDDNLYYESCRTWMPTIRRSLPTTHDKPLVANGALRVRLERKLGYKQAKYLSAIELVDSYAKIGA